MSEVIDFLRYQDRVKEEKREEEQSRKEKKHEERMSLLKEFILVLRDK